jgi:hypothetical protein
MGREIEALNKASPVRFFDSQGQLATEYVNDNLKELGWL